MNLQLPCDVVLLPTEYTEDLAIKCSKLLNEKFGSKSVLKKNEIFPHLSLYMFNLSEGDINLAKSELDKIAKNVSIIKTNALKYNVAEGYGVGYTDVEYPATETMRELQEKVIDVFDKVRSGMREKDKAKMENATGEKLENLKRFGYPAIGKHFRPHITLTRLNEYLPEAVRELPDIDEFNTEFNRLGLFEMGDNGTCIGLIHVVDITELK
jgi:hypothetical protein